MPTDTTIKERLEYLRGELRAGCMSYGELAELQSLAKHIEPGDVELLEAAGVPEHHDDALVLAKYLTVDQLRAVREEWGEETEEFQIFTDALDELEG